MTVSTTTTKNSAAGNGSTTAFTYTFVVTAATELKVYVRTDSTGAQSLKTDGTHYNVTGVGDASGGTVTFTAGNIPASGESVVLLRDTPLTQATDYVENDPFPAASHESALDKLTHQVQEIQEEVDRSLKVANTVTDLTTPEFVDPAAVRAGKFLAFDSDGDELTVTDGPLADAVITSPADADVLLYDLTDTRWENKAVSGDIAITAAGVASIASGVIVNADVHTSAGIVDSKLATISTADKVSAAAIQVDGATDGTGITIADADKLLVDDGGTTKYVNMSQVNAYTSASVAADDLAVGDAASSFASSSGAVLVDSQASTTTVDGHTGVTVQSSNSGDILLDSAADVVLDAAGNDVVFKASGTAIGTLTNSSSDLVITANVQDKDILLKGDDGGSAITALSLDMSDAGKATFSGDVVVTGDLTVSGDDIVMGTNTSGAALIGDGTNFNPVVISGDIAIGTDGTAAIGSGVIVNADVSGSAGIVDTKLATIATANKIDLAALDIDGGTELGEAIVDADLFIADNGAGGTNRKVLASRLKTYAGGAALANDGNNRVVTADGSGGLNGEANLLFDGNLLAQGEDANAEMTVGLTINQGAADDEIFALKSSDIAHGITHLTETDTYFCISKEVAANGGALLQGWSEDKRALHIQGVATAFDTTDTSDSLGGIRIESHKKNGTTTTLVAATEVNVSIGSAGQTQWLIKGNGDVHQTTDAHTTLDAFADSELCRVFDMEFANPASIIKSKWDDFINDEDRKEQLIAAGLISKMSPEHEANGATPLFNASQLQRLHNGAIWQQHEKHHNLLSAVYELAVQSVGEEAADKILEKHDVKLLN